MKNIRRNLRVHYPKEGATAEKEDILGIREKVWHFSNSRNTSCLWISFR
jgi:hypothetical protein